MTTRTAKTVVEVLTWLDGQPHHEVGHLFKTGWSTEATHVYYKNYHDTLRVPMALAKQAGRYIKPNKRPFDTRMFAVTRAGRRLVADAAQS